MKTNNPLDLIPTMGDMVAIEESLHKVDLFLSNLVSSHAELNKGKDLGAFFKNGKKIRPSLVILSSLIYGNLQDSALSAAASVEAIHVASLLHDDVIDEADERRGLASINSCEGNKYTILLGDHLLTLAIDVICQLNDMSMVTAINKAAEEMTLGQLVELEYQYNTKTGIDDYLRMIAGKTASLMAVSCELGGLAGKAPHKDIKLLHNFGLQFGIAFQIVDDMLDFWGDPKLIGKPIGTDLAEGKYTLPLLIALNVATEEQKDRIKQLISKISKDNNGNNESFAELLSIMDAVNAKELTFAQAELYTKQSFNCLDALPQCPSRENLRALALRTLKR